MSFMIWIIEELIRVEEFFYDAYLEVRDWMPPFNLLSYPLYGLYGTFMWLVEGFYEFYQWLDWAADQLEDILSWSNISSLIRSWLYGIEDALDWFLSWTTWVGQYLAEWWPPILDMVLGYVDNAVEDINTLIAGWNDFWTTTWPQWVSIFEDLRSSWDNFWTIIFPDLVSFAWLTTWWNSRLLDVQDLIDTPVKTIMAILEGWQEIRDQVFEFFNDPLEWLWDRFTDWFLGPEV